MPGLRTRDDVEADIKTFSATRNNKAASSQRSTLSVLPYRMRKLNEACESAAKGLATIVPKALLDKPLRGTLGESSDAQREEMERKKAGLLGTLNLSTGKSKDKNN